MTPDAVKAVVDRAPKLTDDQRARIRAILLRAVPAAETLVPTEYDDGPGTRRGRRDHPAAARKRTGAPMLPRRDRDRLAAREPLRRQRHQRDHARAADRLMPLAEFYRQRPGLPQQTERSPELAEG